MTVLKDYLLGLVPDYIREEDSYKDAQQKGFIVRFLEIFGEELDEQFIDYIDNFDINSLNVETVPTNLLDYFEDLQGDIKNFGKSEVVRRNIIKSIISIYRLKGTRESVEAILAIRGYKVNALTEEVSTQYVHDGAGVNYDAAGVQYDAFCGACTTIDVTLDKNFAGSISAEELGIIDQLLLLVLPINTNINTLVVNGVDASNLLNAVYLDEQFTLSQPDPQGDLMYDETDPGMEFSLALDDNGNLVVEGVYAVSYDLTEDGDLVFIS